ncbi:glycoside hydrolase family 5 protein [Candidatus Gracilibacteria bacterium]|nr:glycoside hydrolase family 5 protein [Candidatus Gracilibacteria bacterium]
MYDGSLLLTAQKGFGIIGMLLTTPFWARDSACRSDYWCPPADVNQYAEFASWMVERYDGDGVDDAPGSPRIAAWQIWNEPNDTLLWPNIGNDGNARKRRYGQLLVAAYDAIKAADPTATVLTGGTYIYDGSCAGGICDGFNFFNADGGVFKQVPAARDAFDVFAVHPYIPTDSPDATYIPHVITVQGRLRNARNWLNDAAIGRRDAPIWITEMGWCTAPGTCPGNAIITEEQQANYMVRSLVIAQQTGVQHTSYFQFEDAFDDDGREWSNAAIVRNYTGSAYPPKPAYNAYRVLSSQLRNAVPVGIGPAHTHQYDAENFNGSGGVYHYRYTRGSAIIDVLWVPQGETIASFALESNRSVRLFDRDGGSLGPNVSNGRLNLNLSERPLIVVQE